jgi:hypothetical protein
MRLPSLPTCSSSWEWWRSSQSSLRPASTPLFSIQCSIGYRTRLERFRKSQDDQTGRPPRHLSSFGDHPFWGNDLKKRVLSRDRYREYEQVGSENEPKHVTQNELREFLDDTEFLRTVAPYATGIVRTKDLDAPMQWFVASTFGNYVGHLGGIIRGCAERH